MRIGRNSGLGEPSRPKGVKMSLGEGVDEADTDPYWDVFLG